MVRIALKVYIQKVYTNISASQKDYYILHNDKISFSLKKRGVNIKINDLD